MANLTDHVEVIGLLTEDCQYVQLQHFKVYQRALRKWVGKDLQITIKPLKYKRSDQQNRGYHFYINLIMEWFLETEGVKYTHDEAHIWVQQTLLGVKPKITHMLGETVITMDIKSTSKMTVPEFASMVDTMIHKMAEKGLVLPELRKKSHNFPHELLTDD